MGKKLKETKKSIRKIMKDLKIKPDDDIDIDENYFDEPYPFYNMGAAFAAPQITVREISGGKKNKELARITELILNRKSLSVIEDILLCYNDNTGAYDEIRNKDRFITSVLDKEIIDTLSSHYFNEIIDKIMRTPELQRSMDEFNNTPTQLNCLNGIIDFGGTEIKLLPHSPDRLFNYVITANYCFGKLQPCPVFDKFCESSLEGSNKKQQLLLEMIGYICSDSSDGKCAFFLEGAPNSGKSIIGELITLMFPGGTVVHIQLHQLADRFNRAELYGRKLNIASEIKAKKLNDITFFKMVTGGDRITAEHKGAKPFSFIPRCKLLFSGNALPGTTEADTTKAFANRLVVLLFNKSIAKEDQDKTLLTRLLEEKDTIFTLAIQALHMLHHRNYVFTEPQDSVEFLKAFAEAENPVEAFVGERCTVGADKDVYNTDLYEAFCAYSKDNGIDVLSKQKLYSRIESIQGVRRKKIKKGAEYRQGFIGITLRRDTDLDILDKVEENHCITGESDAQHPQSSGEKVDIDSDIFDT